MPSSCAVFIFKTPQSVQANSCRAAVSEDSAGAVNGGPPSVETAAKTRLQRLRWPLMSLAFIAVLGGGTYFYIEGGRYQSTDDAYAQAATVSVSANVGGASARLTCATMISCSVAPRYLDWTTRHFALP